MKSRNYITIFLMLILTISLILIVSCNKKESPVQESAKDPQMDVDKPKVDSPQISARPADNKADVKAAKTEPGKPSPAQKPEEKKSEEKKLEAEEPAEEQNLAKAPIFQGANLIDGQEISLKDYEGYVLIIDFWASWCPPCKKEIPGFMELHEQYKDKKFAVIGISLDKTKGAVEKFIADQKMNYPVIMATKQIIEEYEKAMGQPIHFIPTTAVVNRKGGIVTVHTKFEEKQKFEEEIKKLL